MSQKHPMETYQGMVRTPADAIKLFEACRLGLLPRVQRRLSEKERQAIRSGSVFVWDEREAGMRRWTDGKSWSASRVSGSFLTYREMEGKRGGGGFNTVRRVSGKTPDSSGRGSDEDQDDGEPDGYRYKVDGLMKQSFSITTSSGQHLHLISYYARPAPGEPDLLQPTADPSLRSVVPVKGMYPESSMSDNTPVAPVPRAMPMPQQQQQHHQHHQHTQHHQHHQHHLQQQQQQQQHQPQHYAHHAPPPPSHSSAAGAPLHYHHQAYPPQYSQPGYSWPPSPVATPPYNHHYTTTSGPPYPPHQHSQHPSQHPSQPPQGHYSRTPPPPGYYTGQPPQSTQSYGSTLPAQYERLPLPPPQPSSVSRPSTTATHASSNGSNGGGSGGALQPLSNSPRSVYGHSPPVLPPVSSAVGSLPPVSHGGPLPALTTTGPGSSSALTPPYQSQQSQQQRQPYYSDAYANGGGPSPSSSSSPTTGGKKASLSALLHHPTPTSSEPNSVNAGSVNSANSSPRHHMSAVGTSLPSSSSAGGGFGGPGRPGGLGGPVGPGLVPQQFLQPAPSGEDSRALLRLDKKFCI